MKSSWAWMMVLVDLGSGLIWTEPPLDVRKLSGTWYPLATAWTGRLMVPVGVHQIQSNDTQSFDLIVSGDSNKKCKEESYTYIAKEGGGFQLKGGKLEVYFVNTNYDDYHIVTLGLRDKPVLLLFGRKKDLTEEMKAKFQRQAAKMEYENNINYRPKPLPCQE